MYFASKFEFSRVKESSMSEPLSVPAEYQESFRRLLLHVAGPLRNDATVLQSILLYLKLGNEKLARIAIDAYNENHRLSELENRRRLREEAMLRENLEEENESEDEDDDFEDDGDKTEEDEEDT